MANAKKSSGNWCSCEKCGCQEWAPITHCCSPNLVSGPWLSGFLELGGEFEDAGRGAVTVSLSAARQCGLVLGETVVLELENSNSAPIARRVWVSRSAAPAAIILPEKELGVEWRKEQNLISLRPLRNLQTPVHDAKEIILDCFDYNFASTQNIIPLLKTNFQHRLFTKWNELTYWHYGKKLIFRILHISCESETKGTDHWYRMTCDTKLCSRIDDKEEKSRTQHKLGGVDDIIEEVEGLIKTALDFNISTTINKLPPPRGILLCGHSGTGKSTICRHIINKLNYHCVSIEGPSIFSKFYGETEKTLAKLYQEAISNEPCILLVDDVDTICPKKASGGTEQERRVAAAFLSGLDSLQRQNSRVFVLATAARSDSLDSALRRAGRLDREIEVAVPDRKKRYQILQSILNTIPHDLSNEDVQTVADAAHGYVAADILNLCSQASTRRIKLSKISSDDKCLQLEDFKWALTVVKASAMREVLVEVPNVLWSDVGGQLELKSQLRQAVEWPLKHSERFESLGIEPPSGVLMYGPPGCSKTLVAKALATESGLNFISIKGPELFSKWVGESERAVRDVFARARRVAPAVVFFDELDALGGERGGGGEAGGVKERVLAQLLTELDGVVPLRGVLVLGATNRPDRIDRALLRPGRLDRLVYVPLPDPETRLEIFKLKLARVPLSSDISLDLLVQGTEGFSGAEVQAVCHEAVLKALDEDINTQTVKLYHFQSVLEHFKPRTPQYLLKIYEEFSSKNR